MIFRVYLASTVSRATIPEGTYGSKAENCGRKNRDKWKEEEEGVESYSEKNGNKGRMEGKIG